VQVNKLLEIATKLDISILAPSHGIIWRRYIKDIVELYKKWASNICDEKAVIVYDTMWGSTEKMAYALNDMFVEKEIACELRSLATNHISDVMTRCCKD